MKNRTKKQKAGSYISLIALFLICAILSGCTGFVEREFTVGKDILSGDVTDFYYTLASSTNPPTHERFRIYSEESGYYLYHEKREGERFPLTEEDISESMTVKLSSAEADEFFDIIEGGKVTEIKESTESGDDGPWTYIYWSGDGEKYRDFSFSSITALNGFLEFCGRIVSGEENKESGEKDAIVIYFSITGNTRRLAGFAAEKYSADIFEIVPAVPYTEEDLEYNTDCRAKREQEDKGARPDFVGEIPDLSGYKTVFIAYPIWYGQAPRIIYTFLESADISGATVIPFCTSEASGIGSSDTDLYELAPGAKWIKGNRFAPDTSKEAFEEWLDSVLP